MTKISSDLFIQAQKLIPGGVNSPVRSGKAVSATPLFISKARGSLIYDVEGRSYLDYVLSWGPMILGHAHPAVVEAIIEAAQRGTSYGAPTELENTMAGLIVEAVPSIELVRFVSSGTEATMSALRLARGYTGRDKIIKFTGCYHGHGDSLLVKAGSGVATLGIPGSPGIPKALAELTLTLPFNDLGAVRKAVDLYGDDIAALIVEPVAGNMGVVPPKEGFLESLRKITEDNGIVLIFDEVITGFRSSFGGYQDEVGIRPDLTCLGKIIGGGLPVGAFGGGKEIMSSLAPLGPVYQAGTLSGNPLAMAAGIATLRFLKENQKEYERLNGNTAKLCASLKEILKKAGVPAGINRAGSMFTLFFTGNEVTDYGSALTSDTGSYARYYREMLSRGIYLAPSQYEAAFVSFAHSDGDLERTIEVSREVIGRIY